MMSVALITIRTQPHFDWYISSLGKQTFKDFELIIVDDRASHERYMEVLTQCAKNGVKLSWYGKSKPTRWAGKRPALCNARNTAFVVANRPYTVFFDDNGYAHPEMLARHVNWANFGLSCAGTWCTFNSGEPSDKLVEVKGLDGQHYYRGDIGPYGFEGRFKQVSVAMPCAPVWLHGGNMSFPLEAALAVNGFDEMYDGEQGVDDCDFGLRIRRAGYKMVFDPTCIVYYNLTSHKLTQSEVAEVKPDKAKIALEAMARKPKEKMLADGKFHFSNELLIQELEGKPNRILANPNFELRKLRDEFRKTLKIEHPLGPETDWRDNQLIEEMK